MKLYTLIKTIGLILAITPTAYALPNGRPFQELNTLIEENAEQNTEAINVLKGQLTLLDGRVGLLETDVSGLTGRFTELESTVNKNKSDITKAKGKLEAALAQVSLNSGAIQTANSAITVAQASIASHQSNLNSLLATREDHNTAINLALQSIAALEAQISELENNPDASSDALAALYIDLGELNDSYASLIAMENTNEEKIAETQSLITNAETNLSQLQSELTELESTIEQTTVLTNEERAALKVSLLDMIENYQVQKSDIEAELNSLEPAMADLASTNNVIAADLQAQMLALTIIIDTDSPSISALHTEVSILSSTLTLLNTHFNDFNSRYLLLKSALQNNSSNIEAILLGLNSLNDTVDAIPAPAMFMFSYIDNLNDDGINLVHQIRKFFQHSSWGGRRYVSLNVKNDYHMLYTQICIDEREPMMQDLGLVNEFSALFQFNVVTRMLIVKFSES